MAIKKFFDTMFRYKHLFNPAATIMHTGESVSNAPTGDLRLSNDPKTNMALWNAIFVLGGAAPLAYLINTLSNRKAESAVEDTSDESSIDKLNALRPRLIADADESNVDAFTELPKRELQQLNEIKQRIGKRASGDDEDSGGWLADLDKTLKEWTGNTASDIAKSVIPFATFPVAVLGAVALSNSANKDRIKQKLRERRAQYRSIQSALDRKLLQQAGLIKGDIQKEANSPLADVTGSGEENTLKALLINIPVTAWALLSGALGIGAFAMFRNSDKNQKVIKYLTKNQLGSNVLQDTPQISVLDLPADPGEILAVPGDKRQIAMLEDKKPKALIEDATLFAEVNPKNKKKDAIF